MCILSAGILQKNINKNNTDKYPCPLPKAHREPDREREGRGRERG